MSDSFEKMLRFSERVAQNSRRLRDAKSDLAGISDDVGNDDTGSGEPISGDDRTKLTLLDACDRRNRKETWAAIAHALAPDTDPGTLRKQTKRFAKKHRIELEPGESGRPKPGN